MKFLLIADKFKGSLTSEEVSRGIQAGIEKVIPRASFLTVKASDGGDGFLDAIARYRPCIGIETVGQDPLGKPILCKYLYNQENTAAYVELANASGMELLNSKDQDPMETSTYGTGLQIKDAIQKGARTIYLGLGGSATNDAGMGIANALGYVFLNDKKEALKPIGKNLIHVHRIDASNVPDSINDVTFYTVNDVTNPLFGTNGAAFVYAKQKGASASAIMKLDKGLENINQIVTNQLGLENALIPGSGAAGGAAYGLKSFFNAEFLHGIDFILELSGITSILASDKFDYIITGEGKIDEQTLHGKLVQGVLALGQRHDIPVIAICGVLDIDLVRVQKIGIQDVIEIQDSNKPLSYNMKHAYELLTTAVEGFFAK